MYRKWEKAASSIDEYSKLSEEDSNELKEYYWEFLNYENFCLLFKDFVNSSKNKFNNLENWKKEEVDIWGEMVNWSMDDFDRFYSLLWIHQDYTIWESFYSDYWVNLVMDLVWESKAVLYTKELAKRDINQLKALLKDKK